MSRDYLSIIEYCRECDWRTECGGSDRLFYDPDPRPDTGYSVDNLHPECSDFVERVTEVNGFSFSDIKARRFSIPKLLPVIPSLRRGDFGSRWNISNCVATTVKDLVHRRPTSQSLRSMHRLRRHTVLIITGCCKDDVLEQLWLRRNSADMFAALQHESPCLVIAPDFSLYVDSPRCNHLFNAKRSLIIFERLQAAGIPAVPFVSLHNKFDVRRWADWLNTNPDVTMVGISFQTLKNETTLWLASANMMQSLDEMTGCRLHWLIIGVATDRKIGQLQRRLRSFSIVPTEPVQAAVRGEVLINGQHFKSPVADKLGLAKINLRDLERRYRGELVLGLDEPLVDHQIPRVDAASSAAGASGYSRQLALISDS